ncbi:MAG: ankyrin repeat domain-containing protein [Gammaproteobacteria bacterium]
MHERKFDSKSLIDSLRESRERVDESIERTQRLLEPINQPWLIACMQKLGYADSAEGLCFGVAAMGMQAILTDNIRTFDERLKKMYKIPIEKFADTIHAAQTSEPVYRRDQEEKQDMIDMLAFCEGVDMCQRGLLMRSHLIEAKKTKDEKEHKKPQKKTQDEIGALGVVKSAMLKEAGMEQAAKFSSTYTPNYVAGLTEIDYFFQNLNKKVKGLYEPIAFFLKSCDHAIVIGYNPNSKKPWSIIDANDLPSKSFKDHSSLGKEVTAAFAIAKGKKAEGPTNTIFTTTVYTTQAQSEQLKERFKNIDTLIFDDKNRPKLVDSAGGSWLLCAALSDDLALVELLIKRKANVNQKGPDGRTPLHIAATIGNAAMVTLLLANGAKPNAKAESDATPLHAAALGGNLEVVEILLKNKKTNPEAQLTSGQTPLAFAALLGHVEVMELLIKNKSSPTKSDKEGVTPLIAACLGGSHDAVKFVLEQKVNPKESGSTGISALHAAAMSGNVDILNTLMPLMDGTSINDTASLPTEALLKIATKFGRLHEVERFFRPSGVGIPTKIAGFTPLAFAVMVGHAGAVRNLLAQHADSKINLRDSALPTREFDLIKFAEALGQDHIVKILKMHQTPSLQSGLTKFAAPRQAGVESAAPTDMKSPKPDRTRQ